MWQHKCKEVFSCHLDIYLNLSTTFTFSREEPRIKKFSTYLEKKKTVWFICVDLLNTSWTVQYEATAAAAVNLINWITKSAYQRL